MKDFIAEISKLIGFMWLGCLMIFIGVGLPFLALLYLITRLK